MSSTTFEISPEVKKMAPVILEEIKKASKILLHCHPSPDPDSVCSALAMKFALEQLGKQATVIKGDSDIPEAFMHFPGAKEIVQKSFGEMDLGQFDLFVSVDAGSPDMISYKNVPIFPLSIRSVVIDHHASNKKYADINLVDTGASTTFILYQLFKTWNVDMVPDIALNLFMGLYTDSGGFKWPPTDHRVFHAAAELVEIVPQYSKTIFQMENGRHKEEIYFQKLALNSIETHLGENLAMACVSLEQLKKDNIPSKYTFSDIPNLLKSVIGWNIGVTILERDPGEIKVSMRSRDPERFDVSKLAVALGGGGHRAAAGIRILNSTIDEVKKNLIAKAKELYNL